MVLRYWRDRRVGKWSNQNGNGFALSTFVLLFLLRFTTYSHPTFGFATAHVHSTSSVASAGTVVHLGIGNFAASVMLLPGSRRRHTRVVGIVVQRHQEER